MGALTKLTTFTCKILIGAGAIYVTVDQGMWGSPESSANVIPTINKNVPQIKAFKDEFIADYMPKIDTSNVNFKHYWNSGVLYTFAFWADSPTNARSLVNYVVENVSSLMSDETASSTSSQSEKSKKS